MQLVLDDQVGRRQRRGQRASSVPVAGAVEAVLVVAVGTAEEGADLAGPGHGGELVDRGDQEAGQAAIDRLVDRQDRQRLVAGEVAASVDADDAQVGRLVRVGHELERVAA